MSTRQWLPGDPAPMFISPSSNAASFHFHSAAGRYLVLCFYGSTLIEKNDKARAFIISKRELYDDKKLSFFGISIDSDDAVKQRVQQAIPGIRYFWDFKCEVSTLYGAVAGKNGDKVDYVGFTLILDPMMRVIAYIPMTDVEAHNRAFEHVMSQLPDITQHAGVPMHAPVLILPRVFEPEFCKQLIALYKEHGGSESGFMREVDGKTVGVLDNNFKKRNDFVFDMLPEYEPLRAAIRQRIIRRLLPEIEKTFQFKVTRMERYIVACYDSEEGGFFRPHRDNNTSATMHRKFACTLNLNTGEYDGGELRFPEFGPQTYRAPTGGAVVFSCSLLHEATPVTRGTRYAFLPFLYDDEAAKLQRENRHLLSGEVIDENKEQYS